jgi:transposase InsO family protein
MKLFKTFEDGVKFLSKGSLHGQCGFSKSQMYEWRQEIRERLPRETKGIPEETVINATSVVWKYPFLGGLKGGLFMVYHRLGLISRHNYDYVRNIVKKIVTHEVLDRALIPDKEKYFHEKPAKIGEIWAEDFTMINVEMQYFFISLVIDVKSSFYLGEEVNRIPDDFLVASPVIQALKKNNGNPPDKFILSDNGKQYLGIEHTDLLDSKNILHKLIPPSTPKYNGTMECGVKQFKNVFYNVWYEKYHDADKEKNLLKKVRAAVKETSHIMNCILPRPVLGGVTPNDVHEDIFLEKIQANTEYCLKEDERKENLINRKDFWKVVKNAIALKNVDDFKLLTKFNFFCKKPLRCMTKLGREVVG